MHTCRCPLLFHVLNLVGLPLTHKCLLVMHTLSHVVLTHTIKLLLLAMHIHTQSFALSMYSYHQNFGSNVIAHQNAGSIWILYASTLHTASDELPNHAIRYMYIFDTHHDILFIVDTAPRSILPADTFQDQATNNVSTCSLFASDGHSLAVFGTVTLTLNFEQLFGKHIDHTFIIADV